MSSGGNRQEEGTASPGQKVEVRTVTERSYPRGCGNKTANQQCLSSRAGLHTSALVKCFSNARIVSPDNRMSLNMPSNLWVNW